MTADRYEDWVVWALLRGPRDPSVPHSLAEALRRGLVPPEYRQEAEAIVGSYPYPRRPSWSLPATPDETDPGWDNVVRAAEEDQ